MTKRYTVEFNAKVTPVKPLNDEFTLCKCYVMALDKNRNLSFIGQDAADDALPTLFNIPVIGHLYVDDEGKYHMGGHDMTIVKDNDGNYKFKSICVPYGVVPQQDDIHYEDIKEPNGDTHTYLVADVILWTGRFPELYEAVYSEETYFGQSMEINVHDYAPLEEDKNYTNILKYAYSALCLLGKSDDPEFHTEPCFPISRVDPYEFSAEDEKFTELMNQLKDELALCFGDDVKKGGEGMNKDDIVVNDPVEPTDNFDAPVSNPEGNAEGSEPLNDSADTVQPELVSQFATYREKRDAVENALPRVHETDGDEVIHEVWHWVCDLDDTYVFVEKREYKRDSGYTEEKGRYSYTFNDADKTASITGEFEEMFIEWLTKDELTALEAQRANYEELVAYKAEKEKAEREAEFDAVMDEFSDLEGIEEFAAVVKNKYSYDNVEALKDACYLIRGKSSKPASKKEPAAGISVPVGTHIEPDIYEGFFARYGNKKTSRN